MPNKDHDQHLLNCKNYYAKTKQYIKCECGQVILKQSQKYHLTTKKHIFLLTNKV